MCASFGDVIQPHALQPKVHECINLRLCVLFARQSSGLQLTFSPLACIYKPKYVCVCARVDVCECMKKGRQVAAPDPLTQHHLYAHECAERRETEKKEFRSMLDAVCVCVCVLTLGMLYSPMPHNQKCMSASI